MNIEFDEELEAFMIKHGIPESEKEAIRESWVGQKTGLINQLKENHQGTQPVRVLQNMIVYMFGNTYPSFKDKLQQMVDQGKLNPAINMIYAEESIVADHHSNSPGVSKDTRQIILHESFLSYLWCISYALYVLYIEKVDYPTINKIAGQEKYKVSPEEIEKAEALFNYGKSLIAYYSPWDKDHLPNPEIYLAEKRDYIEQANICFTEATKFILAHELTHLEKHIDQLNEDTLPSHYQTFEIEADDEAIQHTLKGTPVMGEIFVKVGIVTGLLSMLYFSANTTGIRHPNVENRITRALESIDIDEQHIAWGIAGIGLELWEAQFNLNFEWLPDPSSPKEQYYFLLGQIKKRQ